MQVDFCDDTILMHGGPMRPLYASWRKINDEYIKVIHAL
jgi:hypothetical protein